MAKCADCGRDIVEARYGDETKRLDPIPATYVSVEEHRVFPDDGDRVFRSTALVEHSVVCPAQLRRQAAAQKEYRARHEKQKETRA